MKQKTSLKTIVYNSVLEGIFKDEYKPNQIINEQELVNKFGYSKSPVREALIALCSDGILKNIPRFGYEVVRLTRQDVDQILVYRFILEGGYLTAYYNTITEEQYQRLEHLNTLCNEATEVWEHWEANVNFHLGLLSCSNNQYAYDELKKSMNILKRAYAQFYWEKWNVVTQPTDVSHHVDILDCIRKKDIDRALAYLREDLSDFGV